MFNNATRKITITLGVAVIFGALSLLLAMGPGKFLVLPELAMMAGILAVVSLLLSGFFFCEIESRKLVLMFVGLLAFCLSVPAFAVFMMATCQQ